MIILIYIYFFKFDLYILNYKVEMSVWCLFCIESFWDVCWNWLNGRTKKQFHLSPLVVLYGDARCCFGIISGYQIHKTKSQKPCFQITGQVLLTEWGPLLEILSYQCWASQRDPTCHWEVSDGIYSSCGRVEPVPITVDNEELSRLTQQIVWMITKHTEYWHNSREWRVNQVSTWPSTWSLKTSSVSELTLILHWTLVRLISKAIT